MEVVHVSLSPLWFLIGEGKRSVEAKLFLFIKKNVTYSLNSLIFDLGLPSGIASISCGYTIFTVNNNKSGLCSTSLGTPIKFLVQIALCGVRLGKTRVLVYRNYDNHSCSPSIWDPFFLYLLHLSNQIRFSLSYQEKFLWYQISLFKICFDNRYLIQDLDIRHLFKRYQILKNSFN